MFCTGWLLRIVFIIRSSAENVIAELLTWEVWIAYPIVDKEVWKDLHKKARYINYYMRIAIESPQAPNDAPHSANGLWDFPASPSSAPLCAACKSRTKIPTKLSSSQRPMFSSNYPTTADKSFGRLTIFHNDFLSGLNGEIALAHAVLVCNVELWVFRTNLLNKPSCIPLSA